MRVNRSKTAKRRSHHGLVSAQTAVCECGHPRLSHRACASCGKYGGKVVIDVVAATKRAQRRVKRKEHEMKASGQIKRDADTATSTVAKE